MMIHYYECEVCGKRSLWPTMKLVNYPEICENGKEELRDYNMICQDCVRTKIDLFIRRKEALNHD